MFEAVRAYWEGRTPLQLAKDALDVFLVYYLAYRALLVLRGTRAMQVGLGLSLVFVLYLVAQALRLVTVISVMGALISSMLLIIVVVFQNDIRRGLQRVGSRAWFGSLARAQETKVIDEVVEAATELARHRIGALITFEQDANLDEFVGVHKGHTLDAQVSRELLVALFLPEGMNKLHDGSVVIRNLRIAKAGVFFPMPEGRVVDDSFGSRHRAALGITEETDAVVVIVSEERGTISFCFNGNIASNLDGPKLRTMLDAIFSPKVRKKSRRNKSSRETAPPESLSKNPPVAELDTTPTSRSPRELRDSQPDSMVPRISLIASEPEPMLRPKSEPPPPLRPGPALTPSSPPSAPLRAAPPVAPGATPLRTPVTTSVDRDAVVPPTTDRNSQGDT
ncbi:MAG TPA: diadenylate cyclase CdaA [Polyangiaceae bacterium]|nr:diadenylate cyclase CdaA [Polyangiaceae bacterium]